MDGRSNQAYIFIYNNQIITIMRTKEDIVRWLKNKKCSPYVIKYWENEEVSMMKYIFTKCYSLDEAIELSHFIMGKWYEGVQNDSYRYCKESIEMAFKNNARHGLGYCYIGVNGGRLVVERNKRAMRRKGAYIYIEKPRIFKENLHDLYKDFIAFQKEYLKNRNKQS